MSWLPLVNSCIKNVWPLIMIEWKTSLAQRPALDFDFSFGHKGEEESSNPGVLRFSFFHFENKRKGWMWNSGSEEIKHLTEDHCRVCVCIYYYFLHGMVGFMNLNLFEGCQRNCRFIPNIMDRSSEMDGKEIDEWSVKIGCLSHYLIFYLTLSTARYLFVSSHY